MGKVMFTNILNFVAMKKVLALVLFSSLLWACDNTPAPATGVNALKPVEAAPQPLQTLRGMYKSGAGGSSFFDCATGKTYRAVDETQTLASQYREACEPAPCPNESVYALVQGQLNADALRIIRVDTLTPKTMYNTCQPYDFWCIGTEPFWGLLISEAEGGLFLKNMGDQLGKTFPWTRPQQSGDTWTYRSVDPASGEKLTAIVRRQVCSDGMSDRNYPFTVEVRVGETTLQGCAVPYGTTLRRE